MQHETIDGKLFSKIETVYELALVMQLALEIRDQTGYEGEVISAINAKEIDFPLRLSHEASNELNFMLRAARKGMFKVRLTPSDALELLNGQIVDASHMSQTVYTHDRIHGKSSTRSRDSLRLHPGTT